MSQSKSKRFLCNLYEQLKADTNSIRLVCLLVSLFLSLSLYALYQENYFLLLLPVVLVVCYLFLFHFHSLLLLVAFLTPFSIDSSIVSGNNLSILTEPLLISFSVVFVIRLLFGTHYDRRILFHPLVILVSLSLLWAYITSFTSFLPQVSLKHSLAKTWFIIPLFFAGIEVFKDPKFFKKFFYCYVFSLLIVIILSTYHLASSGFSMRALHTSMKPFYNDHTEYGAILALLIPIAYLFVVRKNEKPSIRLATLICLGILLAALLLSYSRAAWISLCAAIGMYYLIRTKIKMRWVLLSVVLFTGLFYTFQFDVIYRMGKNTQDSSTNFFSHIRSISNISTDDSNIERLNRWAAALRMIEEKPVLGWGPGVYQHVYAPYQKSYQMSLVSTNFGDLGDVHSEYITPFVASGFIGFLLISLIFIYSFWIGVKIYRSNLDESIRQLALFLSLALLTYYVHAFFNNFLTNDKLSVPFWAFTATLVALDIYYHNGNVPTVAPQR